MLLEERMFSSPKELAEKLTSVQYLVVDELLPVIYFAMKLGRPLLVEGPPGSGKTSLPVRRESRWRRGRKTSVLCWDQ